ncbi:MAG: Hint domain-containing protein [Deltaproteobacteria bacterium]|nr:Hint domain-containing protein [Deltaproteobacteria bacterium]
MKDELDDLRDPPRLLDDPEAHGSLRAIVSMPDLAPPSLPTPVRARVRDAIVIQTAPSRGRWIAIGALALVAIALLAWLGTRPEDHGPAPIAADHDAATPLDASVPSDASTTPDAGPIAPRERVPYVEATGNGCGLDLRVWLGPIDDDIVSVALVMDDLTPAPDEPALDRGLVDVDCEGTVVRELDAGLFREASRVTGTVRLPLSLAPPTLVCGHTYTITPCVRDTFGRLATHPRAMQQPTSTRDLEDNRSMGRVQTPSGPASPADLRPGHFITAWQVPTQPPWTTPGSATPYLVESIVVSVGDAFPARVTTLTLGDGRVVVLDASTEVSTIERGFVPADTLLAGERANVLDLTGVHASVPSTVVDVSTQELAERADTTLPWPSVHRLDVSHPDTLFVDGLLVHDARPSRHTGPSPLPVSAPREAVRVMPDASWDCSLAGEVVIDALPADARSIAVVYAPHRGRAGARRALDCSRASVGIELPRALIDALPIDERATEPSATSRRVAFEIAGWDDANDDWHGGPDQERPSASSVRCEAAYTMMACVRGADGALSALPGGEGRWAMTGPACFARGTAVSTGEGEVAIESLREGDRVTSRDPITGEEHEARVRALIPRGIRAIRAITLESGRVLEVTDEHPLFDPITRAFRAAHTFVVGDRLLEIGGHAIAIVDVTSHGAEPVYDLSVGAPHTFFAAGVLVHNY